MGQFPVIDFNPLGGGVQARYCTRNSPGDPALSAGSYSRPMVDVIPLPGSVCRAQTLPGTEGEFSADFISGLIVRAAGSYTFAFYHDDTFALYIGPNRAGQQPTPTNPGVTGPSTGYPYVGGSGGYGGTSITVDFPAPGTYPMEAILYENGNGELGLTMGTSLQDPLLPLSLAGSLASELGSESELYRPPCAGKPVDCATGEFTHSFTDVSIPGRGLPLRFVRTYKALLAAQDGPLGHGWTDSYDMHLTTDASSTVTVTEEGGTDVTFALSGTTYQPPSRVLATLVNNGDGTLTFARRDQTHYTFSTPTTTTVGQLLSQTDRNGYTTTLGYTNGRLSTITDPAGRSLTLTYSGRHISGIADPIGRMVAFTYNTDGDLTEAADVGSGVTHFTYAPDTHLLTRMTDPRGGTVTNTYDSAGRVTAQTDAMGRTISFSYTLDAIGAQQTTITDGKGNVTVELFQSNLLLSRTKGYGTPQAATWTYTYDPGTLGVASETDPNGHTTHNTWDANGNLLSHTAALSRTTSYAYDALNDTTAITDPLGVVTRMTYDAHGNLLSTSRPLVPTAVPSDTATNTATASPTATNAATASPTATSASTDAPTSTPTSADNGTLTPTPTPQSAMVAAFADVVQKNRSLSLAMVALACRAADAAPPCATSVHKLPVCTGHCDSAIGVTGEHIRSVGDNALGARSVPREQVVVGVFDDLASRGARTPTSVPTRARPASRKAGGTRGAPSCSTSRTHCSTATSRRPTPPSPRDARRTTILSIDDSAQGNGLNRFRYVGVWEHCTPCRDGGRIGMYDRSSSFSRRVGAYYALRFRGTSIALYSVHGPTNGIEEVTLDGHSRALIDLYSARRTGDVLDHRYAHLADTTHVLTVHVTGRKTKKSANVDVVADRVAITQVRSTPPRQTPTPPATTATRVAMHLPTYTPTTAPRHTSTPSPVIMPPTATVIPAPPSPSVAATATPTSTTTATPSATPTTTMIPATSTPTNTAPPAPPSATASPAATVTAESTATSTSAPMVTDTATAMLSTTTATAAASPATTSTSAPTGTPTASPTSTSSATTSPTATASSLATSSATSAPTETATDTPTSTATRTPPSSIPCTDAGPLTVTVCLTYDPAHPDDVIARTDANGQTARYAYDAAGNLVRTSDPLGNTTTYQYDLIGRKTVMVRPLGNISGANPISYTTTITYNAFGETTAITDALGDVTTYQYDLNQNLITTTDALGRQTINGYDADNERTSVTRPDGGIVRTGYDPAGNVMTTTDALARSTTYDYDALNRPISMTDPLGRTTLTGYDLAGHVITSIDALGHSTIYGYDAANERTSITRADGGVSRTGYDLDGQVITTTDALGNPTHYSYDSLHRRVGVTDPLQRTTMTGYDLAGNVITTTDPLRRDVVTAYDAAHRPVLVTRPDGSQTHTEYDADGNVTASIDPLGHTTHYGYDVLDRRVTMTDALGHTTVYRYDAVGNHTATIDPLLHTTTMAYDTLDRVITTTDPLSHTTIDGYDLSGNLITATDTLSHTTVYGYDAANERTSATQPDGSALGTGYDADGNVITQTDALGRQTSYGYNAMNHVVAMTNPLTETTAYTYDLAGNRTALMDPMGRTTRYGYNADNEPITVTYSDALTPDVQFTYDKSGQRQSMTDGTGTTSYSYDLLDQPMTVINGAGQTLGYRYDLSGNLTHLIYPDSSVITRTYDAANHWTALTDPVGHTFQFSYDQGNRLTSEVYPTTVPLTSVIGYDGANRVTSITDQQPGGLNWTFGYSRDDNGQVSGSRDPVSGASHRYSYSPLTQLVADQQTTGAVTTTLGYSPDSADQITGTVNGATNATSGETYDLAGELTGMRVTGPSPETSTYGYNVDGDRTSVAAGVGNSSSYGYDQADRLITATVGMTQASYIYDGDGLRQSKIVTTPAGTTTTAETWDTAEGLPLLARDGATEYLTDPNGQPIEAISGTAITYLLHDQLGSTRGVLDSNGSLIASLSYDPYGNITGHTGTTQVPFGFAGEYTDRETGLQYLRARYYDPTTAQFLSRDPLVNTTGQPYAYTTDDPLNATDPSGLCGVFGKHVPFTADDTLSCGLKAEAATLTGLNNFDDSFVSKAVNYGVDKSAGYIADAPQSLFDNFLPPTVLSDPANACDVPRADAHAEREQQRVDTTAGYANWALIGIGAGGVPRVVSDLIRGANHEVDAALGAEAERGDPLLCAHCFVAGTRVATPHGTQPIQTLQVGQQVLSEDPKTHKVEAKEVQRVLHDPAASLVAVDLSDDSTITTTATHSFYVDAGVRIAPEGAWLWAEHLFPGDRLRTADGHGVSVRRVRMGVGHADVYTLTVAKDHTFFVGTARVLVHNCFEKPGPRHFLLRISGKSRTDELNTVVEPGVDVDADITAINAGKGTRVGNNITVTVQK
jgi:RHS repeat-associated protein